jgi:capsular polysaccharide biosynthesis protein
MVTLQNAMMTGQGTIITCNDLLVTESALEFLNPGLVPEGLEQTGDGVFSLAVPPVRHIHEPCLLLKRPWWRNYGHWLVDGATILAMLSTVRLPRDCTIVIGAYEGTAMRAVVLDTLAILAPKVRVVEHRDDETWSFDSLLYVTPVHVPPLYKLPTGIFGLKALLLRDQQHRTGSPRLYIARPHEGDRVLSNETEIIDVCRQRGFGVIYPEQFSIRDQACIFHDVEIVVGVKGAALTNILFSTASAALITLTPADFTDPFFWDLAGQLGIDYTEIYGPLVSSAAPPGRNPFRIDIDAFTNTLDDVLSRIRKPTE